jgi:Flp pilus assembly protein TadD
LSDLGAYAEAIKNYSRALTLDPSYWYAYNNRGLALWAMGDKAAARRDYEKVKELMGHSW